MSGTHARLSASSAERFMECPGSVTLSQYCENEDSVYAAEGTAAHSLAERGLRSGEDAYTFIGEDLGNGYVATVEMAQHVQLYLDEVRALLDELGLDASALRVEERVEDPEIPDFGGTADAIIVAEDRVIVIDFKYGAGIAVEAAGNAQMRYYAFGVLRKLNAPHLKVFTAIVQPRAFHSEGPVRWDAMEGEDLMRWGNEELLPAMARVNAEPEAFSAGEHCRFCPAKLICPKLKADFEALSAPAPEPEAFTDASLAEDYAKIAAVRMRIKAVEDECKKRALQGAPVPGTKLIVGRSTREWKPGAEGQMLEAFGEDAFNEPEVKSPAQAEKLPQGKAFVAEWAFKREGAPSLVPYDKPGQPYDPAKAGSSFAAIDTAAE
jgi:hypothetical protein